METSACSLVVLFAPASFTMEHLFETVWWDHSNLLQSEHDNVHGR